VCRVFAETNIETRLSGGGGGGSAAQTLGPMPQMSSSHCAPAQILRLLPLENHVNETLCQSFVGEVDAKLLQRVTRRS